MITSVLLFLAWFFLLAGLIGLFRFKGVYSRVLNSSKIDSVGIIALIFALITQTGFSMMSLKLLAILLFYLITNPINNQIIASSAKRNGVPHEKGVQQ